jgi:FixJ family two-component response regulator
VSTVETLPEQVIYIVDDDEALRDSLVWLLEGNGYRAVAFETAAAFLQAFQPDWAGCLLLDIRMPGMSGLELFEELRARHCVLPVIFITGHGDVPMAVSVVKKGAQDFIEKPFSERDMLTLIEESLAADRARRAKLLQEADTARRLKALTQREREVLDLMVRGRLNKQIAEELGISSKTVEVHRARVMEKMAANSLAELVHSVLSLETH